MTGSAISAQRLNKKYGIITKMKNYVYVVLSTRLNKIGWEEEFCLDGVFTTREKAEEKRMAIRRLPDVTSVRIKKRELDKE